MSNLEVRLQLRLPRRLKQELFREAERRGVNVGDFVRRLIEKELSANLEDRPVDFPFGENPIRTGRTRGSVDHDRTE